MSRKIIGVTVGTTLPKPNFKQTDPTKGDYIRNKPDFEGLKDQVDIVSELVGDVAVSKQIEDAIAEIPETDLTNYYTKSEVQSHVGDAIAEIVPITDNDIDAICGDTILSGEEVEL